MARPLLLVIAFSGLLAVAVTLLVAGEVGDGSSPTLVVAVFGTFLTSIAIIGAFSIDESSRWPTPWEMLHRAGVSAWFVVALASVVAALLAAATRDDGFLRSLSLILALIGLLLGARGLWGLVSLASDRDRRRLVVDLLARSIRHAPADADRGETDVGEIDTEDHVPAWFLSADSPDLPRWGGVSIDSISSVLRSYADRADSDEMSRLVDDVHAALIVALEAGGWPDFDSYLSSVDTVLGVQRRVFEELALRVLSGRLSDATARGVLLRAGETAIDAAGRARNGNAWPGDEEQRRVERLVARHLTALCRFAGAAAAQSEAAATAPGLRTACERILLAVRWAVDPDPPGMKLPTEHPWRDGLSDPTAALVWLWSAAEAPSGPFGVGLYAICEILTGRKFFGSYWDGLDVCSEIERRLRGVEGERPPGLEGRAALEAAGGLATLSLELGAIRLAALPARNAADGPRDDRHVACELFLAGAGYKPPGRDPVADLAELLTDRPGSSLWTTVCTELGRLPEPVVSPVLRPLHRRADACALAICLRLSPLQGGSDDDRELETFVSRLPDRLLEETAGLAHGLISSTEEPAGAGREKLERRLVEATHFARQIVPGGLPAPSLPAGEGEVGREPDPATAGPVPTARLDCDGAPAAFAEALRRVAAGGPELEVDLIQSDPRWLDDWAELRAGLDAALLAAALSGRARIRRIVPFSISGDAERRATKLHYRWTAALSTAVGCFQSPPGALQGGAAPYQVRLLVLPFSKPASHLPEDRVEIREAAAAPLAAGAGRFEDLWHTFVPDARIGAGSVGLIELGGSNPAAGAATPLEGS